MDRHKKAGPDDGQPAPNTSSNQQLNSTLLPDATPATSLNDEQIHKARPASETLDCSESSSGASARKRRPTQADILIQLAEATELFHAPDGTGYADAILQGHRETWPIRSKGFRDWLCHQFYQAERRAPNSSSLQNALMTIEGQARYDGAEQSVHLRIAAHHGRIYIDLSI